MERRKVSGITIDGPTSRDLDDGIGLRREDGQTYIEVSIADVRSVVAPDSALFERALERTATRYFATGNQPMLPRGLSEDRLSLLAGQARPTLTFSLPLDRLDEPEAIQVKLTEFTSRRQYAYAAVDQILRERTGDDYQLLAELSTIAKALLARRRAAGALVIYDVFKGLALTEEGMVKQLSQDERHVSYIIIQELMILTNQLVAAYCIHNDIPILFRNHTASNAAPMRDQLFHDIELALAHPDHLQFDTVRSRFALLLNRATYGAQLAGHFGLNLPAYAHTTSPIRRIADLIDQHNLVAHSLRRPPVFDRDQLTTMAEHINQLTKELATQKEQHLLGQANHRAQTRIERSNGVNDFLRLEDRDWLRVLKTSARENHLTDALRAAILTRLEANLMKAVHLFPLLFESPSEASDWQELHQTLVDWLAQNPHEAMQLAGIGKAAFGWSEASFDTEFEGPDQARIFRTIGILTIDKVTYTSDCLASPQKKVSQQLAVVDIIAQRVGATFGAKSQTAVVAESPKMPAMGGSAKTALNLLCQARGWSNPVYEVIDQSGPSHQPVIKIVGHFMIGSEEVRSPVMTANSKKDAGELAAQDLLKQVEAKGEVSTGRSESKKTSCHAKQAAAGNFIGALEEHTNEFGLKRPEYRFERVDFQVQCTCTAWRTDGTRLAETGQALSERLAKQAAARTLYLKLYPDFQPT